MESYPESNITVRNNNIKLKKIEAQNDETDWEYLLRLAGTTNQILYDDITAVKPNLYIGMPGTSVSGAVLSLLNRQKLLFDKIASMNNWCEWEKISEIYNEVKKNVLVSDDFVYNCEIDRTDLEYIGWEAEEFYMQIIDSFLDELFAFIEQLRNKDEVDYSFSQCNFDILESIVIDQYGWKNVTDDIIASNEYIQLEYKREKRDLEKIKKGESVLENCQEMIIWVE